MGPSCRAAAVRHVIERERGDDRTDHGRGERLEEPGSLRPGQRHRDVRQGGGITRCEHCCLGSPALTVKELRRTRALAETRQMSAVLMSCSEPVPETRRSRVPAGKCTPLTVDTADFARTAPASVDGAAASHTAPPSPRVALIRTGRLRELRMPGSTTMAPVAFE